MAAGGAEDEDFHRHQGARNARLVVLNPPADVGGRVPWNAGSHRPKGGHKEVFKDATAVVVVPTVDIVIADQQQLGLQGRGVH